MITESLTLNDFRNAVATGLQRKAITQPARWAELYRVMEGSFPGPWSFYNYPWLRAMHNSTAPKVIGMKAAQMGFTETALNKTFYVIDIKRNSVLYVLPNTKPDAADFSTSRFDPILELSPHLQSLFSDVKNIGHKRAGSANLFIRGSRSRSQMKSLPVSLLVFDEVAEMIQENITLALERLSGQLEKQAYLISTPTIAKQNIDKYYSASNQQVFFFKCPGCKRFIELVFPACLEICGDDPRSREILKSRYKCPQCGMYFPSDNRLKIDAMQECEWVPTFTDRIDDGFTIPQTYSPTITASEFAIFYLNSFKTPEDEQEFYNSKLGQPHVVKGAQITDEMIQECMTENMMLSKCAPGRIVTMGVDVGSWLHYEITEWFMLPANNNGAPTPDYNLNARCRILRAGKVTEFEELDNIMHMFGVRSCVIDANPERRKALEFAQRWWGLVKLCFYTRGNIARNITVSENELTCQIDRTNWLDLSLSRFKNKSISLPINLPTEYKDHIKAIVRVYSKDQDGNPVGKYESTDADHFAHARNYSEVAFKLLATIAESKNVNGVF